MSLGIFEQLQETTSFIKKIYAHSPEVGIILGSGLGNLSAEIDLEGEIPYAEIPHFPVSTVQGHQGKLIFGNVHGKKIVIMAGRFHFYEGYTPQQVIFPIRVMRLLGIKNLLISNAAGGINPAFTVGDLMIIKDHIALFTVSPLIGENDERIGTRFPDMSEPYNKELIRKVKTISARLGISLQEGVYAGVTGPTFETRAEYKMLHILGGDAVGMSTVQEVIGAVHMGLPVVAISVITDIGLREEENVITHEEVLEAAKNAEPKLTAIFRELINQI